MRSNYPPCADRRLTLECAVHVHDFTGPATELMQAVDTAGPLLLACGELAGSNERGFLRRIVREIADRVEFSHYNVEGCFVEHMHETAIRIDIADHERLQLAILA